MTNLWSMVAYILFIMFLATAVIFISSLLGQRHSDAATGSPFESGIRATGSARIRFSAKFFLVAVFFVIFDLEAVFIFAWAVAVPELGWSGYIEILIFVGILIAALVYLWRLGALDWGPASPRLRSLENEKDS